MIGIYKITSPSGKIYIGSSIKIEKRLKYYKSLDCKGQTKLYNSLLKYGYDNHKIEVLDECSIDELYLKENHYGNIFNVLGINGLNCVLPKFNDIKKQVSAETLKKMSESKKGYNNTFYGKKHSSESKELISISQKGRKHTAEHKFKVSLNNAKNKAKIIIDLNNGVFYESAKEVSDLYKINHSTLRAMLNGKNKNKTTFQYC